MRVSAKPGKKGQKRPRSRASKINLVFDEEKRKEFLTGFHKRKVQRKKEALQKFEKEIKEERKRLKSEAKESYKKLVVSHRPIPELENLVADEYEEDDVTVKVVELSTNDIAKKNNWIGANQPKYASDEEEEEISEDDNKEEEIPGMELKRKPPIKKEKVESEKKFKSERDIKKELKKQATKKVQKSKIFQKKNKMDRQKQKKKSIHQKKERIKIHDKRSKAKGAAGKR